MWQSQSRCIKVTFCSSDGLDLPGSGRWDRFIRLAIQTGDLLLPGIRTEAPSGVYDALTSITSFMSPSFSTTTNSPPLQNGPVSSHGFFHQVLLPRIFPVPDEGDIPGNVTLRIHQDSSRENIARWRRENLVSGEQFTYFLDKLLSSAVFLAWV